MATTHAKTLADLLVRLNECRGEISRRHQMAEASGKPLRESPDEELEEQDDPGYADDPAERAIIQDIRDLGKALYAEGGSELMDNTLEETMSILGDLGGWAEDVVDKRWEGIGH
jgi:hypothetical protein